MHAFYGIIFNVPPQIVIAGDSAYSLSSLFRYGEILQCIPISGNVFWPLVIVCAVHHIIYNIIYMHNDICIYIYN